MRTLLGVVVATGAVRKKTRENERPTLGQKVRFSKHNKLAMLCQSIYIEESFFNRVC